MRYRYALLCWLAILPISCSEDGPTEDSSATDLRAIVTLFDEPAAGITVQLREPGSSQRLAAVTTDERGEAVFEELKPGSYEVDLDLPPNYGAADGAELKKSVTATEARTARVAFDLILIARDIDGNSYRTTKIGDQIWTAENLRVSRFRNSDAISEVQADAEWKQARIDEAPAWSNYNNDPDLGAAYGKLYNNYAAVDPRGICPEGWHVPSDDEVKTLERFIGMSASQVDATGYRGDVAGKLMSTRTHPDSHPRWAAPNEVATNATGFSVVPLGFRNGMPQNSQHEGAFQELGTEAEFYTHTPSSSGHLARGFVGDERIWRGYGYGHGLGIRCLKN